jgi:hypothetical protein
MKLSLPALYKTGAVYACAFLAIAYWSALVHAPLPVLALTAAGIGLYAYFLSKEA